MTSVAFSLPLSGAVIRWIIDALDLRAADQRVLGGTNARRYLRGERVSPEAATQVQVAVAEALVTSGLLPREFRSELVPPRVADHMPTGSGTCVALALLAQYAEHWDAFAGALRRLSAAVAFPNHAAGACLRLVVIDLAVRTTALAWLMRVEDDQPIPDFWLRPNGVSLWLRDLVKRAGLTRDELAIETKLPPTTVDDWLDKDARPEMGNLRRLAKALASNGAGSEADLIRDLQLAYAAKQIFSAIESVVGRPQALGICERFVFFTNDLMRFPRMSVMPREETDAKMKLTLLFGTLAADRLPMKWIGSMLRRLHQNEHNPVWRTTLHAATGSWFSHMQDITAKLGSVAHAELRDSLGRDPTENDLHALAYTVQASDEELARQPDLAAARQHIVDAGGEIGAHELKLRAREAHSRGDLIAAIALARDAIVEDPTNAEIHFYLGCFLGELGDVAAALAELEIAIQLGVTWDRPWVEVAIVLLNEGRDEEALEKLVAATTSVGSPSTWVLLHLGYVHERLGHEREAIVAYEELLTLEPENGEVLDRVAHLHLVHGDKRLGADRAKRAGHQGIPTVFNAWAAGCYESGGPRDRPPHQGLNGLLQCPDSAWALRARQ